VIGSDLHAVLDAVAATKPLSEGRGLAGVDIATFAKDGGAMPLASYTTIHLHADASVTVLCGAVEMRQGAHTVITQIVAEEFQLPVTAIRIAHADTALTPFDALTAASRGTAQTGLAAQQAAREIRRQLLQLATVQLDADVASLRLDDGCVASDQARLPVTDVLAAASEHYRSELTATGAYGPPQGRFAGFYETAAARASIEVDEETGVLTVDDYRTATDAGIAINPITAHSQEVGGVVMGLGHALGEQLEYDEQGLLANGDLARYRVVRSDDLPRHFSAHMIENADGPGPYGAKGMGESSILTTAPAVGNAVSRAVGHRFRDLPLTPERIWRAVQSSEAHESPG